MKQKGQSEIWRPSRPTKNFPCARHPRRNHFKFCSVNCVMLIVYETFGKSSKQGWPRKWQKSSSYSCLGKIVTWVHDGQSYSFIDNCISMYLFIILSNLFHLAKPKHDLPIVTGNEVQPKTYPLIMWLCFSYHISVI